MKQTLAVTGMTCENCARHVREALESLAGVQAVSVDLAANTVTFEANREIPQAEVAHALDEAGYALA